MTNSVTFPTEYGGDGKTYTDDADPNTGLDGTGYMTRFVPALAGSVVMADHARQKAQESSDSASSASQSASAAANSESAAASSKNSAAATWDTIRGAYYGALPSAPSADPLGNAPSAGDRYYDTTAGVEKTYTGSAWVVNEVGAHEAASDPHTQYMTEARTRNTFEIFAPDPERRAVEAATGGRCTILRAPDGQASYMHIIPKFRCEDVAPGGELGTGVHPAFLVGGVEKDHFMVGMYQAFKDGNHFVSQPRRAPHNYIDFDAAKSGIQASGTGWHLMSNWEWAAIALWCMANGYQPTGNTNWGRSHANTWETGIREDGGIAGDSSGGIACHLTGSGPMAWHHDGTPAGIADLVGSVWEWVDGFKLQDGRIILTPDNDHTLSEAGWVAQDMWISSNAGLTFENTEADVVRDGPIGDNSYGDSASQTWATVGGDPATNLLKQALIMPNGVSDPGGRLYVRNYGERLPFRGGDWGGAGDAGLAALRLSGPRTTAYGSVGFRPAFINP